MRKNEKNKGFAKTAMATLGVIGLVSAVGLGSVAYAAGSRLEAKSDVPTQYTVPNAIVSVETLPEKPATQRTYKIVSKDSTIYKDVPIANAISRDQAADIGAAELSKVFGIDLSGREIEMGYVSAGIANREIWYGDVLISGDWKTGIGYSFSVGAISGELHGVGGGRSIIDANVSLDFDSAVAKNPGVYESLAKEIAEKYDMVGGKVRSSAYENQGYGYNDPDVCILVIGESGLHAQLRFSRYDQRFLAAAYNEARLDTYAYIAEYDN